MTRSSIGLGEGVAILRKMKHDRSSLSAQGMLGAKWFFGTTCLLACLMGKGHALDNELASAPHEGAESENDGIQLASLSTDQRQRKRRRYDYSRFSNGPRWVPRSRGASLRRAMTLGLGTFEAAKTLLRTPPTEAVLDAAGTDRPRRLLWPVVGGRWGRGFGYTRKHRKDLRHNGVDIVAPEGAAVRAAASGIVAYSDNGLRGLGNVVLLVHPNGWCTLYGHNLRNTVQAGWRVKRGERIALVGSTGIAWGPHLHFEFRDRGRLRNPARLFEGVHSRVLSGPLVDIWEQTRSTRQGSKDGKGAEADPHQLEGKDSEGAEADPHQCEGKDSEGAEADPHQLEGKDSEGAEADPHQLEGMALGTVEGARRFLARGPSAQESQAVPGRVFRNLLWPVRGGELARPFQARRHPGVDIRAADNSGVRAAADGVVLYSGDGLSGYGNVIVLLHRNGWITLYGSNRENAVAAGDVVLRGAWIGRVGSSGSAEGPHLHFELVQGGRRRDPVPLFANAPAALAAALH